MQELPCLGGAGQGSSMSTTSDESEAMHTHMPSPGRKQTHTARDDRPSLLKSAVPAKPSSKAQSTLPAAVSLDTGISRSHRTRERDRARERHHDRTKSVVRSRTGISDMAYLYSSRLRLHLVLCSTCICSL